VAYRHEGDLVGGIYQVRSRLGEGTLGPAYQVQGRTQKKLGVLKFLPEGLARNREYALRFVHFYRERRKLQHKGIITVLDLQVEEGVPFVVFPFLGGVNLETLIQAKIQSDQKVTWEEGSEILEGIARVLARAQPFFHGNLKPRNVFLQMDGITLTDDGFLNFLPPEEFLRIQNILPLSSSFLAPELFTDPKPSPSVDLYSFGALAYFIFTGREPVHPIEELTRLRPDLPNPISSFVSRLLSEDPRDRFSSFPELMVEWGKAFARSDLEEEFLPLYQKEEGKKPASSAPPQPTPGKGSKPSIAQLFEEEDQLEITQYQPKEPSTLPASPPLSPPITSAPASQPARHSKSLLFFLLPLAGILALGMIGYWFFFLRKSPSPSTGVSTPSENLQVVKIARDTLLHVEELRAQLEKNYAQLPTFAEAVTLTLRARDLLYKGNNPTQALETAQKAEKLFLRIASLPPPVLQEGSKIAKGNEAVEQEGTASQRKRAEKSPVGSPCPKGMAFVPAGNYRVGSRADDPLRDPLLDREEKTISLNSFCIDLYEYPNKPGTLPKSNVNFSEAKSLCEKEGKRLCTEEEWEASCRGSEGRPFPYGKAWDPDACNTETKEGRDRNLTQSGSFKGCLSPLGVFDMSGNLMEWTQTSFEKDPKRFIMKGGSYLRPNYAARCSYRYPAPQDLRDMEFGFRCCADVK